MLPFFLSQQSATPSHYGLTSCHRNLRNVGGQTESPPHSPLHIRDDWTGAAPIHILQQFLSSPLWCAHLNSHLWVSVLHSTLCRRCAEMQPGEIHSYITIRTSNNTILRCDCMHPFPHCQHCRQESCPTLQDSTSVNCDLCDLKMCACEQQHNGSADTAALEAYVWLRWR